VAGPGCKPRTSRPESQSINQYAAKPHKHNSNIS